MINIGFIGAGGIARAHAFSLNSLKYYYNDAPGINFLSVTSSRETSRSAFATKYGFSLAQDFNVFLKNKDVTCVFILGPNKVHYEHFIAALEMPAVTHIYMEKPVCSSQQEEEQMNSILQKLNKKVSIQVGFQFMQNAAVREAFHFWKSGVLGKPIHFDLKYYDLLI